MKRLMFIAVILSACTVPAAQPGAPVATLAPVYALQDAQTTATAAARAIEATATAQVNIIATEARASIALAEQQTQAALPGMQTSTAVYNANLVATATEGAAVNATQTAATLTAEREQRDRANMEANVWLVLWALTLTPLVICLCWVILRAGYAVEQKVKMASIVIIKNKDENPVGYFLSTNGGPRFHSLEGGGPQLLEAESDTDRQCRDAWRRAVAEVASTAAQAGSWSVNTLSTRGGAGLWPEDTIQRVQAIAEEVGALANYAGSRGWDWAGDWDYVTFTDAIRNGVYFKLPRKAASPDGPPGGILWPIFPEQSKAQPSKAKRSKATV